MIRPIKAAFCIDPKNAAEAQPALNNVEEMEGQPIMLNQKTSP